MGVNVVRADQAWGDVSAAEGNGGKSIYGAYCEEDAIHIPPVGWKKQGVCDNTQAESIRPGEWRFRYSIVIIQDLSNQPNSPKPSMSEDANSLTKLDRSLHQSILLRGEDFGLGSLRKLIQLH